MRFYMIIEIDNQSGFCFGVRKAIDKAEQLLSEGENLISLGEIVHNHEEVERLSLLGMKTIQKEEVSNYQNKTILIRTHGEPPATYSLLQENQNKIVDATCPVVLKLQERVRNSFHSLLDIKGQLVIFGKKDHPEVVSLKGQTSGQAIIVTTLDDLELIDFSRPIEFYSQTTMSVEDFQLISSEIRKRAKNIVNIHDTICRQVSNRAPRLAEFSKKFDVILFVSGKNSSNGKFLYNICRKNNPSSYFISSPDEVEKDWFSTAQRIGICGATSTPFWLMEKVENYVRTILNTPG
jgi:4-hydroxy-3-methylbut-2-en-1-yl diphosphate reductase